MVSSSSPSIASVSSPTPLRHRRARAVQYDISLTNSVSVSASDPPQAQAIQESIMAHGPVETAFTVFSDFENYAGGV